MSTDSLMSFAYGRAVVWRWISEKYISSKNWTTTSVGFEPRAFVRLLRINYLSDTACPDWNF